MQCFFHKGVSADIVIPPIPQPIMENDLILKTPEAKWE